MYDFVYVEVLWPSQPNGVMSSAVSLPNHTFTGQAPRKNVADFGGGCTRDLHRGRHHSFVEIDHEIFSTVILSLPLIQEGQLSVSGERMCTILVNRLED